MEPEGASTLKKQPSSYILHQRLHDIEAKLAKIERQTAADTKPIAPKPSQGSKREKKKSSHSKNDSKDEKDHSSPDSTRSETSKAAAGTSVTSQRAAPQRDLALGTSTTSQNEPKSAASSSSRPDTIDSKRFAQQQEAIEAAERRTEALRSENASLLAQISELTKQLAESQHQTHTAEERTAHFKKELETQTSSLANKVVFQKQITQDVVNKYEILKKDYSDLKQKFDEQVDLVESLRTKLLSVTSAMSSSSAMKPPLPPQIQHEVSASSGSGHISDGGTAPSPSLSHKSDAIGDNKAASSGTFKVPKSPSFFKIFSKRRNSDAPRMRQPDLLPSKDANSQALSEFALDAAEEKVSYAYATDDGTDVEDSSSRGGSPAKVRGVSKSAADASKGGKSVISQSSASKLPLIRRGSVGSQPSSYSGQSVPTTPTKTHVSKLFSQNQPQFEQERSSSLTMSGDLQSASSRPSIVPLHVGTKQSAANRRALASQRYGIIFGVKRGACECGCAFFVKPDTGTQCKSCQHFPSQHANLGEVSTTDEVSEMAPRNTPRGKGEQSSREGESTDKDAESSTPASRASKAALEFAEQTKAELREQLDNGWLLDYSDFYFVEALGKGNSSTVFLGTYHGQDVALKVLRLENHRRDLEDFKKELEVMAAVRSPYIVHFYGATLEPKLVICLEYCSKGSLFHYLQDPSNELSWSLVLRWIIEAVRGINTLHLWKPTIVHRDMKSLNLLIDSNMTIKVCDFGLSRFVQAEQAPATLFKLRGTYAYIGPEVYHGSAFTTKTDVYSLGVVLWEMVFRLINGRHQRPYSEYPNLQHDFQIIIQAATKGIRPTIPAQCPAPVAELIRACWHAEPNMRPSCEELLKRLERLEVEYEERKQIWDRVVFNSSPSSASNRPASAIPNFALQVTSPASSANASPMPTPKMLGNAMPDAGASSPTVPASPSKP